MISPTNEFNNSLVSVYVVLFCKHKYMYQYALCVVRETVDIAL